MFKIIFHFQTIGLMYLYIPVKLQWTFA